MCAELRRVSVIIGARDASEVIHPCLVALQAQSDPSAMEVVVATPAGDATRDVVAREFPWVNCVAAPGRANLGELRGAALASATGEIIAVTDPHCIVGEGWIEAIRRALADADVAGGAVLNAATSSAADVAGYLFDYAPYAPPIAAGPNTDLTGNNIAYRREVLGPPNAYSGAGFLKYFVNKRLAAEGRRMVCEPALVVTYTRRFTLSRLARDRFHFGRCFAASRVAGAPAAFRFAYRVAAPLLPAVVLARLARRLLARRHIRGQVVRAAVPLVIVALAWGAGETAGAILGRGRSCAEVY